MYFHDSDPVSIHTLASAAYNIIRDVNSKRGGPPMLVKDQFVEYIKPEYQKTFRDKMNEAENFFKHADRDHDATLDFNPDQTEILILDAIAQYYRLTGEYPPLYRIYQSWYMANHVNFFNLPDEQKRLLATNAPAVTSMGKMAFFNEVLPVLMRQGL
jgi:hypothetical protein